MTTRDPESDPGSAAWRAGSGVLPRTGPPDLLDAVHGALCLAGSPRPKTWVTNFLFRLKWRNPQGLAWLPDNVGTALRRLVQEGRAVDAPPFGFEAAEPQRSVWLAEHLDPELSARAWPAWMRARPVYPVPADGAAPPPIPEFRDTRERIALARLMLGAGLRGDDPEAMPARVFGRAQAPLLIVNAALAPFLPRVFEALPAALRHHLLGTWLATFDIDQPIWQPLLDWLDRRCAASADSTVDAEDLPPVAVETVARRRLMRGELDSAERALQPLTGPRADVLRATALALRGRWGGAVEVFAGAVKALQKELGAKRGVMAPALLRWHLLSLLAQDSPEAWRAARKLAVAESGSRKPRPAGWGLWAHALAVRLGEEAFDPAVFSGSGGAAPDRPALCMEAADRVVLAAWLGQMSSHWRAPDIESVVRGLDTIGHTAHADLFRQAAARLGWHVPPHPPGAHPWPVAYYGAPREAWRDALAAITALGGARSGEAGAGADRTLTWVLQLDEFGRIVELKPFERSVGARGAVKLRPMSLERAHKHALLDPRDAAVTRCIERCQNAYWGRWGIDVSSAAMALVNHPGVALWTDPSQPVELRESLPELEVRRVQQDDGTEVFEFHLADPVLVPSPPDIGELWTAPDRSVESERRNALRVLQDADGRARLVRITPTQRRVAELVAQRWAVPAGAREELDAALRVLAGHFQLHSDAAAGQEVPGEARLRAQLVPQGEALRLRLVAQPFGAFGPALVPGRGRSRAMTVHEGLELSTRRDLGAEATHLGQVLEALPFLGETGEADAHWLIEDPELALEVLEVLPGLPGIAGLDWPRGKPVRVTPLRADAMKFTLASGQDWFALDGEVQVDEGRVIGLQRLLTLLDGSRRGRFVALGEGEYLALTERLRAQLADLRAMAQAGPGPLKLPAAAAAFVEESLQGVKLKTDAGWSRRLRRLQEAAALQPAPPAGLQAELRPYQAEGHAWMARMAHAGLGAVLADDMGLGKTVQTLALLLTRAPLGPALVIAPTSVCANWVAEAARFAPSLRVQAFGEGDRSAMLEASGPGDLVVASYGLALSEGEAIAARHWATLVLDEAQALKNAATKRARAIGTLQADFRLALSGTPVENRLADLWSLMNLLNPGLLGSANQFGERFASPIERERDEAARSRLRRLVGPFLLRRTKAQVLADLPPRTEIVHRVEPGAEERAFLEAARRHAIERIADAEADNVQRASFQVLAELTRLRRAACDPRLATPECGIVGAKAREFEQLALELVANRHKALVFSQFTDFLDLLTERLRSAGIAHHLLTGSTPAAERARRVAAFQAGEGDLFLISLKAGGFGLNLTAADYVIIVDPWWNPAAEDQASGRAHRIGQQRPVTVYRLVTAGSIEERIIELHRHKRDLADGILEGQDQGRPISAEELRELLRGE
jgi:superfamily II DNA or RNA helicase